MRVAAPEHIKYVFAKGFVVHGELLCGEEYRGGTRMYGTERWRLAGWPGGVLAAEPANPHMMVRDSFARLPFGGEDDAAPAGEDASAPGASTADRGR